MDYRKYVRDAAKVLGNMRELENGSWVTVKGCKIVIPARFAERGLAYVGIETSIVGHFAIILDDQFYGVSNANAMMRITPSSTGKVTYDEDEYYEFTFDPGATVCPSLNLVKVDTLVYSIYDEIISKGRVPWYLNYADLGQLFNTAREHAGANIGQQQEVTELIVSLIARNPQDRTQYYRQTIKTPEDLASKEIAYIPLNSVMFAATTTLGKLSGSHARDGLISALSSPTERLERIEELLRR